MKQILKILSILIVEIALINANCNLNMVSDLTNNHPLLLSPNSPKWLSLTNSPKGSVNIIRDEIVRLACSSASPTKKNSFSNIKNQDVVMAKCKNGNSFEINQRTYSFSDLQCEFPNEVSVVKTGKQCLGKDTELLNVGFKVTNDFIPEYDVCYNNKEAKTLYTEVTVPGTIDKAAPTPREGSWLSHKEEFFKNIDIHSAYSCVAQAETFKRILNKEYFSNNRCCLEKTKLVTNNDMLFGPEQTATSHYLNAVPQWSICNRANWLEVEKRVKNLAISLNRPLQVWSGAYRSMTLPAKWGFSYKDMYLHYTSSSDKGIPVPLYIWKVVFDQQTNKGVAIIEINNPQLALTDVESFVLCEDISRNVNWMNFLERKTIPGGYIYCCDLNNFEFGFAFKTSPFPKATGGILRDENTRSG